MPNKNKFDKKIIEDNQSLFEECLFSMPSCIEIYKNLSNVDKLPNEMSCEERAIHSPQNIQTNVTAAMLIMNYLNKIIHNQPIISHCVEFNNNNNFYTKLNTFKNLQFVKTKRKLSWE
jgi:hypothetical protein